MSVFLEPAALVAAVLGLCVGACLLVLIVAVTFRVINKLT